LARAFAAGGGLGQLLISGQRNNDYPQMFAGAVLIAGMAIVLDLLLGGVGWLVGRTTRSRRAAAKAVEEGAVRDGTVSSSSKRSEAET
jgi:osmoprotectant transport system permease protein